MTPSTLLACPACDRLHRRVRVPGGRVAVCHRCGEPLYRGGGDPIDRPLALFLTAAVLLVLANLFPLMQLQFHGQVVTTTLPGSALELWRTGNRILGLMVLSTGTILPLVLLGGSLGVLMSLRFHRGGIVHARILRWLHLLEPWSMVDVFVLGILVAFVKLAKMAEVLPGPSLMALGLYLLVDVAATASLDWPALWARLEEGS